MLDKSRTLILIPSYQPSDVLNSLVKSLKDNLYKLLVVDDGSGEKYELIFLECV